MPPTRSAGRSAENDADNDQMQEAELQKLKNSYRVLSQDASQYQNEVTCQIRKQQQEIEKLQKEKEEHCKNLNLSESESNQRKQKAQLDDLKAIVEEKEDIEAEILALEQEEARLKAEFQAGNKCHGNGGKKERGSSANKESTDKQIKTLENRLDLSLKKFCTQLAENKQLRKKVTDENLKKRRFDDVYKKLDDYENCIKEEIGKVIDQSNQAYEQREDAQNKIISGKEKADKEEAQHQSEMRELQRSIDHEKKLREFMDIKKNEREEDEYTKAHRKKKEAELRERKAREGEQNIAEKYERAIKEIQEITGQECDENFENLEAVVNTFIENEGRNFADFNYVNEQNNAIENLKDEIDKVEGDEAQFKRNEEKLDRERQTKLQEIEQKQTAVSRGREESEQKVKVYEKVLDQLKRAIQSIFDKIDCPRDSIDELLGASAGIKENNMMQYLGIIEQRTNELLTIKAYLEFKDEEKFDSYDKPIGLLGDGPRPHVQKAEIIAPSTGDGFGSDEGSDDEVKPLSVDELRLRALRNVSKREKELARMNTQSEFHSGDKKKQTNRKK